MTLSYLLHLFAVLVQDPDEDAQVEGHVLVVTWRGVRCLPPPPPPSHPTPPLGDLTNCKLKPNTETENKRERRGTEEKI